MKYKTTQKDRYGNMRSLEIDTGENNMEVPPMTSMIPQYEAVGGLAENHPGEPKGSDTVPAWLTPGEFVVNKEAVDMYGPQIKKMNDAGRAVQDGNMNPNQAPPVYAYDGQQVDMSSAMNRLDQGVTDLRDSRQPTFDLMHNQLISGEWKGWDLPKQENFFNLYKQLKQHHNFESGGQVPVYAKHGTDIKDERVVKMLDSIIIAEGGAEFTNYEGDHPTKFGVTLPTYNRYIDSDGTIEDLKKLTENEARQLFYDKYFIEPGIHKLPEEMWHNVLDQTVNSGPKGAINILQRTIGADVDGAIGPNTIKAAKSFIENVPTSSGQNSEIVFNNLYSLGRDKRYKWLVAEDNKLPEPKDPKNIKKGEKRNLQQFEDGWLNRSNKFKTITPPPSKPNLDAVGNTTNLEVATSPTIPSTPEEPGNGWSLLNLFGGNSSNDNLPEDITAADVNEGSVPHTVIPTPAPPPSKPVIPRDEATAESAFNLWDGGLIPGIDYPSEHKDDEWWWGDSRTSSPTPVTNPGFKDYGELIPRLPIDYDPQGTGGMPEMEKVDPAFQNILRQSTSPDLTTSEEEAVVPNVNKLPMNSLNIPSDDSTTMTTEDMIRAGLIEPSNTMGSLEFPEKYRSADTPAPDYGEAPALQMETDMPIDTAEEIGIPRSNTEVSDYENRMEDLLPLEAQTSMADLESLYRNNESPIPEMFGPDVIGSFSPDERIDPVAGNFSPDKNTPDKIDTGGYDWTRTDWQHRKPSAIQSSIDYKEKELAVFTKHINDLDKNDPRYKEKLEGYRKKIKDKEAEVASEKEALTMSRATRWNETNVYKPMIKEAKITAELTKWKNKLDDPNITSTEKAFVENKVAELEKKWSETDTSKNIKEWEKKLKEESKKVNTKTAEEMYSHWESSKGKMDLKKIYADGDSNPNWNKAKDMLKGTLGFLFGDLFDSGELGRAIAVYLGSRALGYQHGESIGYVSKQYLKRVDAKNAAYDKWLLANSGKYTKKSLSKFKKTRDPAHLIPVGSVPRSQGEQSKWYDKNGQARMAYKFKIKDAAGDDHVYWSWDKDGKSEVEEGWHQDAKSVAGTTEFKEQARKYRNDIEEQLKVLKDKYDIHQNRDDKKGIYTNKYHTTITPAIDKDAVYEWAIDRKLQPEKIGSFLEQAMILATKEARKSDDKPGTIIPYLDRVTIDEQTKNVPELLKDGDHELDTHEATALNKKITENFGAPTNFYNSAWDEYQKGKRKSDGKPWPEVFKEIAADPSKNEGNWTPFALFTDNLLYEWMKETEAKRGSGDFTLNKFGKD